MISVIILTHNEELDIERCLCSVGWTDDIHILDSGSTDGTLGIAVKCGAKISQHPFQSFGQQRNYALNNLDFKYKWILFLDADEVATPRFRDAVFEAVESADEETAGFYLCWKMMLEDRWLKFCDNYPKWQFRLLRKGRATFTDFGHGQKEGEIRGKLNYIKEPYLHYSFSKGWTQWVFRHNNYSTLEAKARTDERPPFRNIFSKTPSLRNPALKSWLTDLPGWPLLRFLHAYIFNRGFMEGTPGFIYCINMAYYEFLVQIKIRELKRKRTSLKRQDVHSYSPSTGKI